MVGKLLHQGNRFCLANFHACAPAHKRLISYSMGTDNWLWNKSRFDHHIGMCVYEDQISSKYCNKDSLWT